MIKAIIFDFDGVICESVNVKTEAFRRLFEEYPAHVDKVVQLHVENGGMSRFKKFEIIYRDFLKEELTEEKSRQLGEKFSEYCFEGVINSSYVAGAHEFLEKYYQKIPLFVASGTPHEEIQAVVDKRQLRKYFRGVHGSPTSKADIIKGILNEFDLKREEVIFVGDSDNDLEGAEGAGVRFIARLNDDATCVFDGLAKNDIIEDLTELPSIVEKSGAL